MVETTVDLPDDVDESRVENVAVEDGEIVVEHERGDVVEFIDADDLSIAIDADADFDVAVIDGNRHNFSVGVNKDDAVSGHANTLRDSHPHDTDVYDGQWYFNNMEYRER